jgi:hypothetical protein
MAIVLILVITIIIIERYVNRSDTKAVKESESKGFSTNQKSFFNKDTMI